MRLTAFLFSTLLTALMVSAAEPQVIKPERGRNLVGRVTVDGASRQGVVVSDGVNVVTTDENGVYQMNSSGRQHVFVSVPADCKIPLENGMPKIYEEIDFGDRKHPVQIDFRLERCAKAENFTLVAMADIQPGDLVEIAMLDEQIMPGMEEFASTLSGNVYGISLGDVVWNNPALYDSYKTHIRRMGIPVFHVIGNHDHNEFVHDDTLSDKDFRDAFGPTYYSCNIGDWHLVALDDILMSGIRGRSDYTGEITPQQLDWLRKDLSHVDKDKSIIIGVHIPTMRRNAPARVNNADSLYELLKDFKDVRILSGHTHYNFKTDIAPNITEQTVASMMGAFWNGDICDDGSPRGFAVYEFDGNKIANNYYKGSATPRDYQIKIYQPKEASYRFGKDSEGKPNKIDNDSVLINVFFWHTDWKVELKEDDKDWVTLTNDFILDPEAVKLYQGKNPWEKRPSAEPTKRNDHMFLYKPSKRKWKTITVRATDPYGNVYSTTEKRK